MKFVCTTARFVNRTALSVLMLAAVLPLSATECVWTGSSGNWGDESCWSGRVKPSAAGDTVTINGENVTVTVGETDIASFGFVTNITVASATSRIVVDTASDVTSPAEFRGKGKLVKTGTSKLSLSYAGIKANGYAAIGLFGELIISNGVVQLPNRTASDRALLTR